ncbi:MAG: hypothetical protein KF831_01195 [Acidobacteria bacterium]|nr:hypothetical protein [Acidobacteriota bacterium]
MYGYKVSKESSRSGGRSGSYGDPLATEFPLRTALGVCLRSLVLFGDMGKALYNVDGAGGQFHSPPPPPNSWQ